MCILRHDFRAWDKFDVDKALEELDQGEEEEQASVPPSSTASRPPVRGSAPQSSAQGLYEPTWLRRHHNVEKWLNSPSHTTLCVCFIVFVGPLRSGLPRPTLSNLPHDSVARERLAEQEKVKGNESMRSGDFEVRSHFFSHLGGEQRCCMRVGSRRPSPLSAQLSSPRASDMPASPM
jgi:hypothetical protein